MTATSDDWLNLETMAATDSGNGYYALRCILEIRDRLAALEQAAQQQPPAVKDSLTAQPPAGLSLIDELATPEQIRAATGAPQPPAGLSLIDELAAAIGGEGALPLNWRPEARRAVTVIVRELRKQQQHEADAVANWLEQEAAK